MGEDVLVVVVTHNSAAVIAPLLETLPAALGGLSSEVVVVDNGSTDATADVVGRYPEVHLERARNDGFAAGVNAGVRHGGRANSILVLNPDVILAPGSIASMYRALQRPGVGIVAPKVFDVQGRQHNSLRREPSFLRAVGLNWTGLPVFSEYLSREETDFCLKAKDLGLATWFEPAAEVTHIGGASGQSPSTHVMQMVNKVRLYRRRHSAPAGALYYALTVLSEMTWIARGGGPSSRAAVLALLLPSRRPEVLAASNSLVPH
jgi:GT2 family glycosyltransferase